MTNNHNRRRRGLLLTAGGLVCLLLTLLLGLGFCAPAQPTLEELLLQIPRDQLQADDLYISTDRQRYQGEMWLSIPAIGVETAVGATTDPQDLRQLPGLYEFSQMPDEPEGNVSIAGHRDIFNMVFLELDQLVQGDDLVLEYEGQKYWYRVTATQVVRPDNWDVIRRQGFACLTLTTCDPVGTAQNRLVVTGTLEEITAV